MKEVTTTAVKVTRSITNGDADAALVAGLKAGDENAFHELLEKYTEKVHNLAMRITRNQEDTEEVLQDVFVTIYRKINKFEGKSLFSSWLYRITSNTSFMKLRKRRQTPAVSLEDLPNGLQENFLSEARATNDVELISTRHELRDRLESAVAKLPTEYKAIFILRDVDGLSNEEVSELLQVSVPAVKSRLHRARQMLRKKLAVVHKEYGTRELLRAA